MSKIDAYITARDVNPRGLKSYHREMLGDAPLLHHVIHKLQQMECLNEIAIVCDTIDDFLRDCESRFGVRLHNSSLPDIARRDHFRKCRLWSTAGWRGGLDYASAYDEDMWPQAFVGVLEKHPADFVFQVGSEWPAFDSDLSRQLITYGQGVAQSARVVFSQASPGLLGTLYSPQTFRHMAQNNLTLRDALAVNNKGEDNMDDSHGPGNYEVAPALSRNPWRFTADSDHQLSWMRTLVAAQPDLLKPETPWAQWLEAAKQHPFVGSPHREVEWEWVGPGGELLSDELFASLSEALTQQNDMLVTVDGRGCLLDHPQWHSFSNSLMEKRCHGLHLRLPVTALKKEHVTELLTSRASVVSFSFDDDPAGLEQTALVKEFCEARNREHGSLVVVELTRCRRLLPHWEAFWDTWFPLTDHVQWRTPTPQMGRNEDPDMQRFMRRERHPCRKIFHELQIRHDGTLVQCREDYDNQFVLGRYPELSLEEASEKLRSLWMAQREGIILGPVKAVWLGIR